MDISANKNGFTVEGRTFKWSDLKSDNNVSPSTYIQKGHYYVEFNDGQNASRLYFECKSSMSFYEMADKVNQANDRYYLLNNCVSLRDTWGVDAEITGNRIDKKIADEMKTYLDITHIPNYAAGNVPSYTVRASEKGIWLEDSQNNTISSSLKTWADLGIHSWMEGSDIRETINYFYDDDDGTTDTYVNFTFKLNNVTSVDSVIDGLDGMEINCTNFENTYKYGCKADLNSVKGLEKVSIEMKYKQDKEEITGAKVSFWEELALGRDFDQKTDNLEGSITCDTANKQAALQFKDSNGNAIIQFDGSYGEIADSMYNDALKFLKRAEEEKKADALNGTSSQGENEVYSLKTLLGKNMITTCGNFSGDTLFIDPNDQGLQLTDGKVDNKGTKEGKGKPNSTYATAFIDFDKLGTDYQLDDLDGLGFDSTCRTCPQHYSIEFVDFAQAGISPDGNTKTGYAYNYNSYVEDITNLDIQYKFGRKERTNHILKIDINSLKDKGVNSGDKMAAALLEITDEKFDFHYTQYAANGSKLYIFDNRPEGGSTANRSPAKQAQFNTNPYVAHNSSYELNLETTDGRRANVTYQYDFSGIKDQVSAAVTADTNGDYVKKTDSNGNYYYEKYDPTVHNNSEPRYRVDVSYGNGAASAEDVARAYVDGKAKEMIEKTTVSYNAMDYSTMLMGDDEFRNKAKEGIFEVSMTENDQFQIPDRDTVPYAKAWLRIQHSGEQTDSTFLPRFSMGLGTLNMEDASTVHIYDALNTVDRTDEALTYVSSRRSIYGAYQNRLEHTLNNTANIEENTQAAEAAIRDTDMAKEAVSYFRYQILEQAGQSMFAQANQQGSSVLALLQ